jgi:dolichol-phosphate mannosyltransferase
MNLPDPKVQYSNSSQCAGYSMPRAGRPAISIITPAYNEAQNLPILYERLVLALKSEGEWEWIIVDDHSSDDTFAAISELATKDARIRGFRFARNFGSHTAIVCGFHHSRGDCAVIMAADLQDPPETIPLLIKERQAGAQVVWAVRAHREGEEKTTIGFSRLYYFLMRRVVGLTGTPSTGADFFLIDRQVIDAFCSFGEANVSIFALITWMGFRQALVHYDKKARLHGRSGWNLEKKIKLVLDSVTSFTYLPIRLMSYTGFAIAFIGFLYSFWVIINALAGRPAQGWTSLMVVVLVIGGIQMLMMGVLGEYLWRALDESRRRPRYLVEAKTPPSASQQKVSAP